MHLYLYNMKKMRLFFLIALVLALLIPAASWAQDYARPELLIETDELAKLLEHSTTNVSLIDVEDKKTYQRAHIPGAVNLFYRFLADLESRKKNGYPATTEDAEKLLGEAGVDKDTLVVIYDSGKGPSASAVWFALDFFGHKNVKVLNGGFRKWVKESRLVTQDVPEVEKKKFVANPDPKKVVTLKWMIKKLPKKKALLVDTRSFKEFIGENIISGASRGGHIPGALNLQWQKLANDMETFKSAKQIKKTLAKRGINEDTKVVTYCQIGMGRSTFLILAMKLIGYDNVVEYTGSWEEWSADPRLPIEK